MISTMHVVCPHCGTTNRFPPDRPADAARCGRCRSALFAGRPAAVDEAGFDRHVAGSGIPVLADIWAPWCGPCRTMAPAFERAAALLEPEWRLVRLNADEAPEISRRYSVRSIPTLLLFRHGRLLARHAGALDAAGIVAWARGNLARTTGD